MAGSWAACSITTWEPRAMAGTSQIKSVGSRAASGPQHFVLFIPHVKAIRHSSSTHLLVRSRIGIFLDRYPWDQEEP